MPAPSAKACMTGFTDALLRRDLGAALSLLSDEAMLFYSNGTVLRKADFATVMPAAWATVENYRYATSNLTWLIETEAACAAVYGFEWSGTVRDQQVGGSGRATRVFTKAEAGWFLSHEHLSAGQAPG